MIKEDIINIITTKEDKIISKDKRNKLYKDKKITDKEYIHNLYLEYYGSYDKY